MAQLGNEVMEELIGKKGLEFNYDKSMYLIMGNKKVRKKMNEDIEKSPMKLGNQTMKEAKAIKLLGDLISINLEESVHQTVMKRAGVVNHAIFEARTVIEDTRANSLGALDVAFNIWNSGILAMLLYNSETWINISKKTIRVLDNLFT